MYTAPPPFPGATLTVTGLIRLFRRLGVVHPVRRARWVLYLLHR